MTSPALAHALPITLPLDDVNALWDRRIDLDRDGRMIGESFETLYREGEATGRLLMLHLHPWLIGQPFRVGTLDAALDRIVGRQGPAEVEGYIPQGIRRVHDRGRPGYQRALDKLHGRAHQSEVPTPRRRACPRPRRGQDGAGSLMLEIHARDAPGARIAPATRWLSPGFRSPRVGCHRAELRSRSRMGVARPEPRTL